MKSPNTILRHIVNSISDSNVRYLLLYAKTLQQWSAAKEVMCDDGMWHTAWFSDPYPNQLGARNAITIYHGV